MNRKRHLILLALTLIVFSLLERIFTDFDNKFFFLLALFIGGLVAKEKGFLDQGLDKIKELILKKKPEWWLHTHI